MDNRYSFLSQKKRKKLFPNIKYFNITSDESNKNKGHFNYLKMYNISESNEKTTKNQVINIKLKYKKKYEALKKIFLKPKKISKENEVGFRWPKLTKPKLPFTRKNNITPEERRKKIMSLKPNPKYCDFNTIKWLRSKYSDSLIEKSINTLLPDNGKPVIPDDESEEERKHRILMEFLDSLKPVIEREKNVNINPKYFFNIKTFEKILKLKEIFLEFDEDGSRKMELDEMLTMFNQNHICADINELVNLFFKNKKFKKNDVMNLYLDFYQFMKFAINKEQDFRNFMRDIKEKYKKDKNLEQNTYLPMNFNLVLDYFIVKGKEPFTIEAIENSMNAMDKILDKRKNKKLQFPKSELQRKDSTDPQTQRLQHRLSSKNGSSPRKSMNISKSLNLKFRLFDRLTDFLGLKAL